MGATGAPRILPANIPGGLWDLYLLFTIISVFIFIRPVFTGCEMLPEGCFIFMKHYTCQGFREILPCKKANAVQRKNLNSPSENAVHFHVQLHCKNHLIIILPGCMLLL
jgi:hypothetical protein